MIVINDSNGRAIGMMGDGGEVEKDGIAAALPEENELVVQEGPGDLQVPGVIEEALAFVEMRPLITCCRCGRAGVEAYTYTSTLCAECAHEDMTRMTRLAKTNTGWMELAKDSGLDVWERQPGETDWEYRIWAEYRDCYPGAKPTYKQLADKMGLASQVVVGAARRWDYTARMQAWMQFVDGGTLATRRQKAYEANEAYISMAEELRGKLARAVSGLTPELLKPAELNALIKTAFDLDKKAGLEKEGLVAAAHDSWVEEGSKDLKRSDTPTGDLAEVVAILAKAGALGDITRIGVRKTTVEETIVESEGDGVAD